MKGHEEHTTVKAFKLFAEKLQDPKYCEQKVMEVFVAIATEIADELENDSRQN